MLKLHRYIGCIIGTIIVCVMGVLCLLALYNNEYETVEGIGLLTLLIGLPFSLLIFPLEDFFIALGIADIVCILILCLLNWSVIGYVLSIFWERWRKL